jgi:hypothetical protein
MNLEHVARKLDLSVRCGGDHLDRNVAGGVVGDLLSDVIAKGQAGQVWVTMQTHANIVAVAVLKDLAGIILVQGRQPADDTARKAEEENIPILVSPLPAFETTGKLYALLQTGR